MATKSPRGWGWVRIKGKVYYCGCKRLKGKPARSFCYCGKSAGGGRVKKGKPTCFSLIGGKAGTARKVKCPKGN